MTAPVALLSIGTADAPHDMPQTQVAEVARQLFQDQFPQFDRMAKVFDTAGIRHRQGHRVCDIDRFICHPGGMKVIDAMEAALSMDQGTLDHERAVLAGHGNMSAPTVLHVLNRARHAGLPPRSVVTALGPGFTVSTVTLSRAA